MKTRHAWAVSAVWCVVTAAVIMLVASGCQMMPESIGGGVAKVTTPYYFQGGPNSKRTAPVMEWEVAPVGEVKKYTGYFRLTEDTEEGETERLVQGVLKTKPGTFPAVLIDDDGVTHIVKATELLAVTEEIIAEGVQPSVTVNGRMKLVASSVLQPLTAQSNPGFLSNLAMAALGMFGFHQMGQASGGNSPVILGDSALENWQGLLPNANAGP